MDMNKNLLATLTNDKITHLYCNSTVHMLCIQDCQVNVPVL